MNPHPDSELRPDGTPLVIEGQVDESQVKSYVMVPFWLAAGVERLEIAYTWQPGHDTVFDLGLWDESGYRDPRGFRGWSGSRQGLVHDGHEPIWLEAEAADRCFTAGPLQPGRWHVELGVAAVAVGGARYRVELRAFPESTGTPGIAADPVDSSHVARASSGAFHVDLHQHGRHSHPRAPGWDEFVANSRAAGLDALPIIEYVVDRHWYELGAVQRAEPDLLVIPGREVITYFGHLVVHGETPGFIEYRHGFEDISVADIQQAAVTNDALFQVAHPTIYPEETFGSYCHGCFFSLGAEIDWGSVDTLEVVTATSYFEEVGVTNPFVETAIDLWHDKLRAGHRITAVAGSDDKLGDGFGSAASTILAPELSQHALCEALRAGHGYVRAHGVHRSPGLALEAQSDRGTTATFGDTMEGGAELAISVSGAAGQTLRVLANGDEVDRITMERDEHIYRLRIEPLPGSGPLGTFWGCEIHDDNTLTALANPVFLRSDLGR